MVFVGSEGHPHRMRRTARKANTSTRFRTSSAGNGFGYANRKNQPWAMTAHPPKMALIFRIDPAPSGPASPRNSPPQNAQRDNLDIPVVSIYMSARVSEAFVLQTWPFREGD